MILNMKKTSIYITIFIAVLLFPNSLIAQQLRAVAINPSSKSNEEAKTFLDSIATPIGAQPSINRNTHRSEASTRRNQPKPKQAVQMVTHEKKFNITTIKGLMSACQEVEKEQKGLPYHERGYGLCFGYMQGIKHTHDIQRRAGSKSKICIPQTATWYQLMRVFLRWADARPDKWQIPAWTGVVLAWKHSWPCIRP